MEVNLTWKSFWSGSIEPHAVRLGNLIPCGCVLLSMERSRERSKSEPFAEREVYNESSARRAYFSTTFNCLASSISIRGTPSTSFTSPFAWIVFPL